jgi:endonuclease/exonuclease/phosphatase family metal-dependent hydrolase
MIRLATYNVENLFDRPAVLNLKDQAKTNEYLDKIAELQNLIDQSGYSAADKARILALAIDLERYIEIQEDVGKLFTGRGDNRRVTASGRAAWIGGIQFRRANFSGEQRKNTAAMLKVIGADIQCLVEVEGNQALRSFNAELLNYRFKQHLSIDSPNDPRGIDLGIYLRNAALGTIHTNAFDKKAGRGVWSRDCLEIACQLPSGETLHLLLNHFKSKMDNSPAADARRKGQAARVAEILQQRYVGKVDYFAVVGDLNDTPASDPISPLATSGLVKDVFDVVNHPADDRWTYFYRGQFNQIDYVMVSPKLATKVKKVEVLRQGMPIAAERPNLGITPLPGVTGHSTAASDHGAIVVDLDL